MSIAICPAWIPAKTAANRLGTTVYRIHNLALAGQIRTKTEPGSLPRFNVEDIDRLAAERAESDSAAASN